MVPVTLMNPFDVCARREDVAPGMRLDVLHTGAPHLPPWTLSLSCCSTNGAHDPHRLLARLLRNLRDRPLNWSLEYRRELKYPLIQLKRGTKIDRWILRGLHQHDSFAGRQHRHTFNVSLMVLVYMNAALSIQRLSQTVSRARVPGSRLIGGRQDTRPSGSYDEKRGG